MKNTLILLAATAGIAFAAPSFADKTTSEVNTKSKVTRGDDGSYKEKSSSTEKKVDDAGTATKAETKVDVEVDADGDSEKTVTTESTVDPKGLLNKQKVTTKDTVTAKDGKVEAKHTKKVNGKTVEDIANESVAR